MTRLKAYWRLMRRMWKRRNGSLTTNIDEEIIDFDTRPYLGWMEEEWNNRFL